MNDETTKPDVRLLKINRRVKQEIIEGAVETAIRQAVTKKKDAYAVIDAIEVGPEETRVVLTGDAPVTTALKQALSKRYRKARIVASPLSEEQAKGLFA